MMEHGEHDILGEILSRGVMKNRKFKNQKNRAGVAGPASTDESLTKEQRVEINSIKDALAVARGLSLMEEHQKKRMTKNTPKANSR